MAGKAKGFKIGLGVAGLFIEAEKFEHEWFFEEVFRFRDELSFAGEALDAGLVAAEGKAFVEAGGFLTFQFADVPIRLPGFDLVEAAFVRVFDAEQLDVVGPAQGEGVVEFSRRCLRNCQLVRRRLTNRVGFQFFRQCLKNWLSL